MRLSEDSKEGETVPFYSGLQVITTVLREKLWFWGFFHDCEKAELDVSYCCCSCGAEHQTCFPLAYWVCCVMLFAFASWASSEFCH